MPARKWSFTPDYNHILDAARNRKPRRVPLYEHGLHPAVMEPLLGKPFWEMMFNGNYADTVEAYRRFFEFGAMHGYDVIPVELGATGVVQGGHGLCGHCPPLVTSRTEIERFPWNELKGKYLALFETQFKAMAEARPPGMKAIGGIGNGIFEVAQDFVTLMQLPFLRADDPEGYELLWQKIGDFFIELWSWLLDRYSEDYVVFRMGDDLGYRSSTMLSPADIRKYIIPQYKRVVSLVHAKGKPFLLHSCGCIFSVMDDIIREVQIDAKHSNEDPIAPFKKWLDQYNDRIGLFGGVDMDFLCRASEQEIRERTLELLRLSEHYRGFALGSGNSIAEYVPPQNFIAMTETVREYRGDTRA
jgi:uroporphyrinogen decarboxylase